MIKTFAYSVLLGLFFISCTQDAGVSESSLVLSDTLSLNIDEETFYETMSTFQFEENGKEYLFHLNDRKGKLQGIVFDLEKGTIAYKVPIFQDGPNSISTPLGIARMGKDRYLIPSSSSYIYQINSEGEITDKWSLWDKESFFKDFCRTQVISGLNAPLLMKDSTWYFMQAHVGFPKKKEQWSQTPIFAFLNLSGDKLGKTGFCYPDIFLEDEAEGVRAYFSEFSYDSDGSRTAVSFEYADSIYVSSDFAHVKAICAKSRYLEHLQYKPYDVQQDLMSRLRDSESKPRYWHLIYDKYRQVWYRFALHEYDMPKTESPQEFTKTGQPFSIIILDKNFNVIGETVFPAGQYAYRMWFVGRKGLYLSMNNVKNPIHDENRLVFQCLELNP